MPYVQPPDHMFARIYCMGTPFVWWAAAAAPVLFLAWVVLRAIAPRLLPPYLRPAPPSPPAATAEDDSARPVAEGSEAAQAPSAEGSKTAPAEVASSKEVGTAGSEVGSPAEKAAGESATTEAGKGKGAGALGSASATINGSLLLVGYIASARPKHRPPGTRMDVT